MQEAPAGAAAEMGWRPSQKAAVHLARETNRWKEVEDIDTRLALSRETPGEEVQCDVSKIEK